MISIFRVEVVEDAEEVIGAVQLAAGDSGCLPVKRSLIPGVLSHGPISEKSQEISQRFEANNFDGVCKQWTVKIIVFNRVF